MKIGIIAAMEEELSLLLANLLDAQEHQVLSKLTIRVVLASMSSFWYSQVLEK